MNPKQTKESIRKEKNLKGHSVNHIVKQNLFLVKNKSGAFTYTKSNRSVLYKMVWFENKKPLTVILTDTSDVSEVITGEIKFALQKENAEKHQKMA